ncbi:HTH DNA binding protein [Mycobacterium phage RedRock]|uniref:HTH DNA binding protein n=1 Tax=Mycobacterium phage RedRock TaxID=711470 RepID=D3JZB1_9CAUD|nr:HTH DNA binding protein [Mycobacterium phage AnnaL29]YP_009101302.1 HTH DNA binding protein [Mycobacterium phage RedRock]YP_009303502.1 HTH DNA binding protein [Mycobacterium phage Loser]ADB93742.1 HTH DNA binding protein [Mycobacterium phage RedRock]AGS82730.1 HTH DNA binding domain protein [Mycobacterium phage AnnaL29]AMS00945.1 HTH DNA binding protein [Mycobacterium phage Loser]
MKYVTKKQLRQELDDERAWSASLEKENDQLTADNMTLRQKNGEVYAANVSLSRAANEALRANRELRSQLETAKRAFGEAFVKGEPEPPKGPSRPNRKKLTDQEVRDIRDAYFGGARQKDLAGKYGVNPATISRTVRGVYH